MELPTTFAGIAAVVLAVLPGIPGDKCYRLLVGADWREDTWRKVLRLLSFSVAGLCLYWGVARLVGAPLPVYVLPNALERIQLQQLDGVFISLGGQFVGAAIAGIASALSVRLLARLASSTAYGNAWDHFINTCVKGHWIVVGLQNGESYAGYVDVADTSVTAAERDIILREPAIYDSAVGHYRFIEHQSLFILGSVVSSVAVLHEPTLDKRVVPIGDTLFGKETSHGNIEQGRRGAGQTREGIIPPIGTHEQAVVAGSNTDPATDTKIKIGPAA